MAILRAVSAATAYHWVYRDRVKPWLIADLLILKPAMPRSLISCYESIDRALDSLARDDGRSGAAQRQARAMHAKLERASMTEIFQSGLHEFITSFIEDNARLADDDLGAISFHLSGRGAAHADQDFARNDAFLRAGGPLDHPESAADAAKLRRQYVLGWRIGVDIDGPLRRARTPSATSSRPFPIRRAVERFDGFREGRSRRLDAVGVVRGAVEPLPPEMFLRTARSPRPTAPCEIRRRRGGGAADPLDACTR